MGPAGSPPTPHRGRAGSHVGPVARHMPPPGSSCVAEAAVGRRLGRVGTAAWHRRHTQGKVTALVSGSGWAAFQGRQSGHKASL